MYVASLMSQFMQNLSRIYHGAAKGILRYLKETSSYGLWYSSSNDLVLCGFLIMIG